MPLVKTIDIFIFQSQQLLEAAPRTTRLSTKYHVDTATKGHLVVKTYDPVSGHCIRFKTNRATDLARLLTGQCRLAHTMTNQPWTVESSAGGIPTAKLDESIELCKPGEQGKQTKSESKRTKRNRHTKRNK